MSASPPRRFLAPVSMADVDAITAPSRPGPRQAIAGEYALETPFAGPTQGSTTAAPPVKTARALDDIISSLDSSQDERREEQPGDTALKKASKREGVSCARHARSASRTTSSVSVTPSSDIVIGSSPQTRERTDVVPSCDALYGNRRRAIPQRDLDMRRDRGSEDRDRRERHTPPRESDAEQQRFESHSIRPDPILEKMEEKEKVFDEKVREIDRTFYRVGHQLVVRDDIIERLQRELEKLRREVNVAASGIGKDDAVSESRLPSGNTGHDENWRKREQAVVEQLATLAQSLKDERDAAKRSNESVTGELNQLRAALAASQAGAAQHQARVAHLVAEQEEAQRRLRDQKRQFREQVEALRDGHQKDLERLTSHFRQLEDRCARAEQARQESEQIGSATQAQLLELRLNADHDRRHDANRHEKLWEDHARLSEDVEAARLSTARLLQVMAQVPVLRDFLRWNELNHEFVFLGYPTRYFPDTAGPNDASRPENGKTTYEEDGTWGSRRGGKRGVPCVDVSGLSRQTGVDEGVYGGTASAQDTKNVWFNGNWVAALHSILQAENQFLRLKRIKLYEMEEAAQLSEQLPSARDVLECRQQERDYWVPYAVFEAAQKFKNKFCPRVPAISHFFPFLTQLNRIWNARMQERVRVLKTQLQACQRELQHANTKYTRLVGGGIGSSNRNHRALNRSASGVRTSSFATASTQGGGPAKGMYSVSPPLNGSRRDAYFVLGKAVSEAEEEHYRLRRDVRLNVVSQGSLQLFRLYDALVGRVLGCAREAVTVTQAALCNEEEDDSTFLRALGVGSGAGVRDHAARREWHDTADTATDGDTDLDLSAGPPPLEPRHGGLPPTANVQDHHTPLDSDRLSLMRQNVATVGDHLLAQILACSQDLLELMALLRSGVDHNARAPTTRHATMTSADASSVTDSNSPTRVLHREIRELLRAQYGESAAMRSRTATPVKFSEENARPWSGPSSTTPDQTLPYVIDTALDYSNEVRHIVLEAYEALQRIALDKS